MARRAQAAEYCGRDGGKAQGTERADERIGALLNWGRIEQMLSAVYAAGEGRPAYRPLVMLRALLLQQWYSLSDPELEEALCDRLSFRRFVGLSLEEEVPDHSTLSRYRSKLVERGLSAQVFAEVNRQLERRGLMVKRGTLIDASLVEASIKPPRDAESTPGQGSALDPDADWTRRKGGGGSHFGYKAHVAVDESSGLIRKALLTSAKVNDSEVADNSSVAMSRWCTRTRLARLHRAAREASADGNRRRDHAPCAMGHRAPSGSGVGCAQLKSVADPFSGRAQLRRDEAVVRLPASARPGDSRATACSFI